MSNKISLVGAIVAGAFVVHCCPVGLVADEAIDAGEKLYKRERCETCHGGNLQGSAAFPNLLTSPKTADKARSPRSFWKAKAQCLRSRPMRKSPKASIACSLTSAAKTEITTGFFTLPVPMAPGNFWV